MELKNLFIASLFLILTAPLAMAQSKGDPRTAQALGQTEDLLRNERQRTELFKKDQRAKGTDDEVQSLTKGNQAQTQEIYSLSADIFGPLMESVGNDPAKAMELLQKAQSNPQAFYESLPDTIKARIKGVSSQIEQSSKK